MLKKLRCISTGIVCILMFTMLFAGQVFAEEVTIIGTVNDNYQIVTEDGDVYEVADTDMGNDLLNHVGKTVEALGTITEEEGVKVITVTNYTVMDE